MASEEHLSLLTKGAYEWNLWRDANPVGRPDFRNSNLNGFDFRKFNLVNSNFRKASLRGSNFENVNLRGVNFRGCNLAFATFKKANLDRASFFEANLYKVNFDRANLIRADLHNSNLIRANLSEANLSNSDLRGVNLKKANLHITNFNKTNLSGANLTQATLNKAILVSTNLEDANISECKIFGISAWEVNLSNTKQDNLIISKKGEPIITVDNLEVAQFIYLMLNSHKIRNVINTIGKKAVLILGRFTSKRKEVLDIFRQELRKHNYLPIMFDFEKPKERDFTETILTLAGLSRFIIADISEPRSIPLELQSIIPNFMIPVVPIIVEGESPFSMFHDLQIKYDWVLATVNYKDKHELINNFRESVLVKAEEKYETLSIKKIKFSSQINEISKA